MTDSLAPRATADKAQIARAAGVVMALFVVSRALGLAREMVISHQFGTGGDLDAYLAAFRLPDLIFQIVAGGALGSAFIPVFAGYLAADDRRGAWRLASAVMNLVFVITTAVSGLAALMAPQIVAYVIAPGFGPAQQALTAQLMRIMLITPAIFGVSGIVMAILNARQHFALPALAPILYNLGIIAGALFLAPTLGVLGLALGVVSGAACHLLIQVPGLIHERLRYTPVLGLHDPGVRDVGLLMLPRMLGLAAVQLNFLVNTILASTLVEGSLAALNYAWLLMLLPQGIFAQAVATAAFPTFSMQVARGQRAEMRSTLAATLRVVLYLALPAAIGLIVLCVPLVQFLFQRGAFGTDSTRLVAWALALYALGLPAHSLLEIIVRAFYALHDTRTPVAVGVAAMALNVALSLALLPVFATLAWPPHGALALSNSLATTSEAAVLLWLVRRRLGGLEGAEMVRAVARTGLAAAAMGVAAGLALRLLAGASPWLMVGVPILAGVAVYGLLSLALGSSEPRSLWRMIRTRGRAGAASPK